MAATIAIHDSRRRNTVARATTFLQIAERYRETLENAALDNFDQVMASAFGRCLRVLPDRENWYLRGSHDCGHTPAGIGPASAAAGSCKTQELLAVGAETAPAAMGMYLKKHRSRTWLTRIAATLGVAPPPSPGRIEADNALALQSLDIDVMPLMAYGEKLHGDGRLESFLLSEELEGYSELQDLIERRFPLRTDQSPTDRDLRRLIVQVADIARRFHAAGFNHRDFYCCHFLVKEESGGQFDVRLIDLQRVQHRRWFRHRWIVKDLAQLASMSPDSQVGCREKILFLKTYLGVRKLRAQDKRLVRAVLGKEAQIRRRARHKP